MSAVVQALAAGPLDESLSAVFPEGFRPGNVWLEEDVCYVNLPSRLLESLPEDARLDMALEALARSLSSLESVDEVRFLVDGEFARSYGPVNIARPYSEG